MTELEQKAEEYVCKETTITTKEVPYDNWSYQNVEFEDEVKQAFKDGYEQGQQAKSLEVICKDCSIKKQVGKQCDDLLKENAELKVELEKWKTEWNEQVIKANDEGYARTLQSIEIEKLKAQIEKMKCCGNCKYFTGEKCTYAYRTVNYNDSCETWGVAE